MATVCGVWVVATVCGMRVVATVCGVWVVATVCGVWVALEVRVCVVQVVAEVTMRGAAEVLFGSGSPAFPRVLEVLVAAER